MITGQFKARAVRSPALEGAELYTLLSSFYATEPVAAAAYPHYRLVSCAGRRAMISPGLYWLNRQIICRQKSKQTGKIKAIESDHSTMFDSWAVKPEPTRKYSKIFCFFCFPFLRTVQLFNSSVHIPIEQK